MTVIDGGEITGTRDKDYDLLWFTETCLSNVLRLQLYIDDAIAAGDEDARTLFEKARSDSLKGAEQGKALLRARLA